MGKEIDKAILELIIKKKKGVTVGTAAAAYNKIREALKEMEEQTK